MNRQEIIQLLVVVAVASIIARLLLVNRIFPDNIRQIASKLF